MMTSNNTVTCLGCVDKTNDTVHQPLFDVNIVNKFTKENE